MTSKSGIYLRARLPTGAGTRPHSAEPTARTTCLAYCEVGTVPGSEENDADSIQGLGGVVMENDLQDVLREADRSFVVAALQALWRERVAAFMVAEEIAKSRGLRPLDSAEFGIEDTRNMLLRFGAKPPFF